uniref:Uncharacterized protein n=1 Tax=Odontella aurita TaxID=265563 RepID=A0A7S4K188_9STRA|mmetsp:Transcript_59087/g.175673  ORF Transcript_59087/g.175673 Transcript_59087/m.175673 type:complete len:273 (+) Transcript_59087:31-849(+)
MINLLKSAGTRVFHRRSSMGSMSTSDGGPPPMPADVRKKAIKFVERRQWNRLRSLLLAIKESEHSLVVDCAQYGQSRSHNLAGANAKDGLTFLHCLCRYQPPVDIVEAAIELFPELVTASDKSSRVPLHLAVFFDAPLDVVRALLKSDKGCAAAQDINGKTPLMLVCEEIARPSLTTFYDFKDISKIALLADFIHALAIFCPDAVALEDNEGRTALECALDGEAPKETIRCLQHATIEHEMGANASTYGSDVPSCIEFIMDKSSMELENHRQ